MDHIHVINQLLERCREYKTPLVLTFVGYEKAFDSIEINAVLQAIHCQGIADDYVAPIQELNSSCSTDITLFYRPLHIPVARGVKQGDTISPKLFNAGLEEIFRKLNWSSGININGDHDGARHQPQTIPLTKSSLDKLLHDQRGCHYHQRSKTLSPPLQHHCAASTPLWK
uniref:Reverse transcriptase domain-containing protein n=1 Tax=Plectus sambesii TaxID=2011161 RepID=A0A914UP34_9BILA